MSMAFAVGMGLLLPGCATFSKGKPAFQAKVSEGDTLRGVMGCQGNLLTENPLCVEKIMPKRIQSGKLFDYTIKVTNPNNCGMEDVVISEKMPEKFDISNAVPEPAKVTGRVAEWNLGSFDPREAKVITVSGIAQSAGMATSCTKVTYNPLLCLRPEVVSSDLKVMVEAPGQIMLCEPIPIKVVVTNTGKTSAQNMKATLSLPPGLAAQDGKQLPVMVIASLAGGASTSYNLTLKAEKAGSYSQKVVLVAEGGVSILSSPVVTSVKQPVLKLMVHGPKKILVNKDAEYKITVENDGDADSSNTLIVSRIPEGMKFVSASNGGTADASKVTWNVGVLEDQKSVNLSVTYRGVSENLAKASVAVKGACCQEVSEAVMTEVQGIPALHLEFSDSEDPIAIGGVENFNVTLTNQGSAAAKHIVLNVALEKNFDYISSTGPTVAKAENAKELEFAPLSSLAPKQKAVWEIRAKAVEEGNHLFHVSIKSDSLEKPIEKTEPTRVY